MLRNWLKKTKTHKTKKFFWGVDKPLLLVLVGLLVFGLIAVFNSSIAAAFRDFGDQYHFVRDQGTYIGLGLIGLFLASFIDYHEWYKFAVPLLFVTLILLVAVFIPGLGVKALGAKRWVNLVVVRVQPTELAKLTLVIYLSAWFAYKEKSRFLPFLFLLGVVVGLVILQPDMGTTLIIVGIAATLYFVSGAPLIQFLILIPVVIGAFGLLALVAPYRMSRLTTFFNPNIDPLGSSYHIRQILIAFGSGGWFGVGLGKSRQKYEYLPEANTDSIFAIIAEEIGFLGGALMILAFLFIVYRAFIISQKAPDRFGKLLACGIGAWFAIQTIINLASMVALMPLTGVPLPFISYGGSNVIMLLVGFGILLNISKQQTTQRR